MKTINPTTANLLNTAVFSTLLIAFLAFATSCEKTAYEIEKQKETAYSATADNSGSLINIGEAVMDDVTPTPGGKVSPGYKNIDFKFQVDNCTVTGRNISVIPKYNTKYTYDWVVNGKYAGNKLQLNCTTGSKVTLTLTRVVDQAHITKSLYFKTNPTLPSS